LKKELKNAFGIGTVCVGTYMISYYIRNILSILSPVISDAGVYSKDSLALFSSVYMIVYSVGQLLNGVLGDYIRPKYMVLFGLTVSASGMLMFSFGGGSVFGIICFVLIGFGLSMLRGPLVKVISENTLPQYARFICVLFSFASFSGPLLVGVVSVLFGWSEMYMFSALFTYALAVISFFILSIFEKKGIIKPIAQKQAEAVKPKQKLDLLTLFKLDGFVLYLFVGMVVEIAGASICYWMTRYFRDVYSLQQETAAGIYSAISLIRSFCPFVCLIIFKLLKENDKLIIRVSFSLASLMMLSTAFIKSTYLSIGAFAIALVCSSIASATLWSIYIPSLAKSGKVSGANGVLDCSGYFAAALLNYIVAPMIDSVGWSGVTVLWSGVMAFGVAVTFVAKRKRANG